MRTRILTILLSGVIVCNNVLGQTQTTEETSAPTPPTTETTTTSTTSKGSGLVLGVFDSWGFSYYSSQMRFLHKFPGIDGQYSADIDSDTFSFTDENIEIHSIGLDYRTSNIYMYDQYYSAIRIGANYSRNMAAADMESKILQYVSTRGSVQITVDWLSHTVYWCDTSLKIIVATSGEWEKVEDSQKAIIAHTYLEAPDGITIDPLEGFLFWSDNGVHPKIERALTDGKQRHTIVQKSLKSPTSLEVDIFAQRLYWVDAYTESVLSAKYDGSDVQFITRMHGAWLYDLAIFRDVVYVADADGSYLFTLDKVTGNKRNDAIDYYYYDEAIYAVSVFAEETQPLKETDYCADLKCEHMCVSEKNGAKCMCGDGFLFNAATQKCDEYAGAYHKAFVYANASHICLVRMESLTQMGDFAPECKFTMIKPQQTTTPQAASTTPKTPQQTVAPEDSIKLIELNMKDRYVFFVTKDNRIFKRAIDLPIDNNYADELAVGSSDVSGLAYDPVDRNLFWSQDDGLVYVINVDVKDVWMLDVDFPINKPKDLILLIDQRKLAFIAGDANNMSIITMDLDGTNMESVLENYDSITSLVFERETELFYFLLAENRYIYTIPLKGANETDLFTSYTSSTTYILLEYHNYLIWVYNSSQDPNIISVRDESRIYIAAGQGSFDEVSTIVDLKILDAEKQAAELGPCLKNNGGCAHICISKFVRGTVFNVCECKKGYTMAANKKNCTSEPFLDDFILFSDWSNDELLAIGLGTNQLRAIPERESYLYTAVYLDPDTLRIYWSAYYDSLIYSSKLNGSDVKVETDLGIAYPYMYAKDSSTGNMYYTSYYYQHIGVITPGGDTIWLNDDFSYESLSVIELHPGNGHIYYAVRDSFFEEASIHRSDMDGQNPTTLTKYGLFKDIRGLAIDFIHDHLYISDFEDDVVVRCDLDGNYCGTFLETTNMQITEIATDGFYLYYASYKQDYIVRVDLQKPENFITMGKNQGLGKVNTISFYSSKNQNIQPVDNACASNNGLGDCSTICLPTPVGRTCACEPGVSMHVDDRTCSDLKLCNAIIKQKDQVTNESLEISLHATCLRRENTTCEYVCPDKYAPVNKSMTTLTCKNDGWDREIHQLCEEIRCPATFDNGAIDQKCSTNVGSVCKHITCNDGYTSTKTEIYCREDGMWHGMEQGICMPYTCDSSILHGRLDPSCARTVGTKCSITCDKYYDFAAPIKATEITCRESGWNMDTSNLCEEATCDSNSFMNGILDPGCVSRIGQSCEFTCNNSYINTAEKVVCKFDQQWHPKQACTGVYCPVEIERGFVGKNCSRSVNSVCQYQCVGIFSPVSMLEKITCLPSGQWNVSKNLCGVPKVTEKEKSKMSTDTTIAVGMIILAVIAAVLVIALIVMWKKKRSTSSYITEDLAINNPGYTETNFESRNTSAYSTIQSSQSSGPKLEYINPSPMYDNQPKPDKKSEEVQPSSVYDNIEPLPEVSSVDVKPDKAVMTYNDWIKERQKDQDRL